MSKNNFLELDIIKKFPSKYPDISFLGYASNLVNVEKFIAVAGILAPPLVEYKGMIFLEENFSILEKEKFFEKLTQHSEIERYVNMVSLWDFFLLAFDESAEDEYLFSTFANLLKQFWQMYLHHQYPEKHFIVELASNGMYSEDWLCISFYQNKE